MLIVKSKKLYLTFFFDFFLPPFFFFFGLLWAGGGATFIGKNKFDFSMDWKLESPLPLMFLWVGPLKECQGPVLIVNIN